MTREEDKEAPNDASWLKDELGLFVKLAAPSVLTQVFQNLIWMETAMFVGSFLGTDALGAVSLGNLTGNLTGLSLCLGILSALDTLAPQAMGIKQYREVGVLCIRGFFLCCIAMVLSFVLWLRAEPILLALGQPPEVCRLAARFLWYFCLGVPPYIYFIVVQRFLSCQNIVRPIVWISLFVACIVHPLLLPILTWHLNLGFDGASLSITISLWIMAILSWVHLKYNVPVTSKPSDLWVTLFDGLHNPATWPGFVWREALQWDGIKAVLNLAIPGIFGMSEWWVWEILAFMAGEFGPAQLAAHTIAYNVIPLAYMIPHGISIGVSTRVGTLMAEGKVDMAKALSKWSMGLGSIVVGVYVIITYASADVVIGWFSTEADVVATCKTLWIHMCLYLVFDGIWAMNRGILLGLGLQGRMSVAIFFSLWVVALPAVYWQAFIVGREILGLWVVTPWCYMLLNIILFFAYGLADWQLIAKSIQDSLRTDWKESQALYD